MPQEISDTQAPASKNVELPDREPLTFSDAFPRDDSKPINQEPDNCNGQTIRAGDNSGVDNTPQGFPKDFQFFDSAKIRAGDQAGEDDAAPGAEDTPETSKGLTEAIDTADFDQIYKTVKDLGQKPDELEKLAGELNKELAAYGMSASVNYPDKNSKENPELVLKHNIDDGFSRTENSITFSSKPGTPAFETSQTTNLDGSGSGGGGPLKPNGKEPTVSHILRRMSHDRTH